MVFYRINIFMRLNTQQIFIHQENIEINKIIFIMYLTLKWMAPLYED
jgi:hypothetical protein